MNKEKVMKYEISKELFEAVSGFKVEWIKIEEQGDYVFIIDDVNCSYLLDSFFFECKEWALEQGYYITTSQEYCYTLNKNSNLCHEALLAESEQQYCFDACQWILDNKE